MLQDEKVRLNYFKTQMAIFKLRVIAFVRSACTEENMRKVMVTNKVEYTALNTTAGKPQLLKNLCREPLQEMG